MRTPRSIWSYYRSLEDVRKTTTDINRDSQPPGRESDFKPVDGYEICVLLVFNSVLKLKDSDRGTNFPTSCGFPSWRPVTCKVRRSFQLLWSFIILYSRRFYCAFHFITWEERVSHIALFQFAISVSSEILISFYYAVSLLQLDINFFSLCS